MTSNKQSRLTMQRIMTTNDVTNDLTSDNYSAYGN
eukprot:CAMPEP_0172520228 /NCGR_PEP_ID=MMETSP1066-20121228/291881_1 /TAXON_ID=671091 /ORGANISM="Coscinodiscus wailesii, Strain CCMP2513" /LENGTH=34 /DNA_ID= /DNA_START= /DNA_END= /DNA_ORIENTATION=